MGDFFLAAERTGPKLKFKITRALACNTDVPARKQLANLSLDYRVNIKTVIRNFPMRASVRTRARTSVTRCIPRFGTLAKFTRV